MMIRGAAVRPEFERGQAVEVRRSHLGRDVWRGAKIHRRTSAGYEVIYNEGPQAPAHIMRPDLRPVEIVRTRPEVKVTTPLLSAADIEAYNARIEAEEKSRPSECAPAPPEPAPPPAPAQTLVLVRRSSESGMQRMRRQPKVHNPTPLALALRNARVGKGMQQHVVASLAKLRHTSRLSPIEFGDSLPNDDELLNLSIVLDLDLDHLLELRDNPEPQRKSRIVETGPKLPDYEPKALGGVPIMHSPAPPEPAPPPAPPPAPRPEPLRELPPRELPPAASRELELLREENAILRRAVVFYAGLER